MIAVMENVLDLLVNLLAKIVDIIWSFNQGWCFRLCKKTRASSRFCRPLSPSWERKSMLLPSKRTTIDRGSWWLHFFIPIRFDFEVDYQFDSVPGETWEHEEQWSCNSDTWKLYICTYSPAVYAMCINSCSIYRAFYSYWCSGWLAIFKIWLTSWTRCTMIFRTNKQSIFPWILRTLRPDPSSWTSICIKISCQIL